MALVMSADGQFSLLKDVNPGSGSNNGLFLRKLKPGTWIVSWNGGASQGQELWKTDGTTAGTEVIKDLYPGPGWGTGYSSDPYGVVMNNQLYFTGTENGTDFGLYKTNGTTAGTALVGTSLIPYSITNIDNTLFFGGATSQYGIELYKSDGTAAGTVLIKDIWPGNSNGLRPSSPATLFVKANGYVFFRASDGVHGFELWRTDGTTSGTQMVKDIFEGTGDGLPVTYQYVSTLEYMIEWKGILYFVAQSGAGREELWRTDGTGAGTYKVSALNGTGYRPFVSQLILMGDHLYFLYKLSDGNIKLFSSDGTAAGTKEVVSQSFSLTSEYLAKGTSLFYFSVHTPETGFEMWRSDGTAAGTFMIKDLNPGPAYGQFPLTYGNCMVNWNDIYFTGDNGQTGREIFFSDGSPGNSSLLFDAVPGIGDSYPFVYSNVGNRLTAKLTSGPSGEETWISDKQILFVSLLSFTGTRDISSARLEWKTINEENTSYFEIEKSTDSNSFNRIGTVQAQGGNVNESNYAYTDPDLPPGTYYYRLKVFNSDGNFKHSYVVTVEIPAQQLPDDPFKLLTNPSRGSIKVRIGKTESVNDELQITDMAGRLVKRQKLVLSATGSMVTIEPNNMVSGTYILSYIKNGKRLHSAGFIFYSY